MSRRPFTPKVVTANALLEGDAVWLTEDDRWSRDMADAELIEDEAIADDGEHVAAARRGPCLQDQHPGVLHQVLGPALVVGQGEGESVGPLQQLRRGAGNEKAGVEIGAIKRSEDGDGEDFCARPAPPGHRRADHMRIAMDR